MESAHGDSRRVARGGNDPVSPRDQPRYYARNGAPLTLRGWIAARETDRRVARDILPDGKVVSTVWLGLDHRFSEDGPPLIFETMVFPSETDFLDMDCERYSTEAEARAGHAATVAKWSK